ncbi:MAG: copper chaperone PCu(A)C [Ilumatobacteraceae bacterium]|nr:copper chaperone PCu(A)C [Ilumatobacteraceae bacterium]
MKPARTFAFVAASMVLAGCAQTANAPSALTVERARIGATPAGADAAAYFDIRAGGDERLTGAATVLSARTSLHEMREVDGGGIMTPVEAVDLPAGVVVRFEPFGDHVMLEDLERDLLSGDKVTITLSFADHESVEVEATVVDLIDLAEENR